MPAECAFVFDCKNNVFRPNKCLKLAVGLIYCDADHVVLNVVAGVFAKLDEFI